jgi:protein-disulfide isomerase
VSSSKQKRQQLRAERENRQRARQQQAHRKRRLLQLSGIVLVAVAVVAVAVAISTGGSSSSPAQGQPPAGINEVQAEFGGIPQQGIALGNPSAPVTLVEFGDLKCPVCRQYNLAVLPTLIDRYVRPGKVRMEFRNLAFVGEQENPGDSLQAARMAGAAGLQNHLWDFAALFYLNQQPEGIRYVTDPFVSQIGSGVPGLNVQQALADRSSPVVQQQLDQANSLFEQNGFGGTPSFLVGKTGQQPLAPFTPTALDPSQFSSALDKSLR